MDNTKIQDDVRALRGLMLQQSDWTQLADAPLTENQRVAWSTYRQALRDLPSTNLPAILADVVWPRSPNQGDAS